MIYDFGGFDPRLRDIVYAAPGAPDVAKSAHKLLADAGLAPELVEQRGYDHGVWVPLVLICPDAAILFPKYKAGPINGAPLTDEDLKREAMKVDISALLGGDLYKALRERSETAKKRFSTERDESKALLERKRCLAKLQKDFDIPDEVLMTLPGTEAIEDRARRAKEKAAKRRQRSQSVADEAANKPAPNADEWDI